MRDLQGLLARMFDVALMIVCGAAVASHMRFDNIGHRRLYGSRSWRLPRRSRSVLFPGFGVYESWRGRSKRVLAGQVRLRGSSCRRARSMVMFSLHRIDFVSRLWFAYWTAIRAAC